MTVARRYIAAALAAGVALSGCGPLPVLRSAPAAETTIEDARIPRVLVAEGMKKLRAKQYDDASRIFNAGLKFAPDDARLHFLNAVTYHLMYLRGDEAARQLAATGYDTALAIEPAHYLAALQLGRLEYDAKRYASAVEAFQRAADIDPESGEAHLGIAMAAYYAQDLERARAAVAKAAPLLRTSAAAAQAEAMVYAGTGEEARARTAVARFDALEADGSARARLHQRVNQWRTWHASLATLPAGEVPRPEERPIVVAQASGPAIPPGMLTSSGGSASKEPAMARWTDCDSAQASAATSYGSTSSSGAYGTPTADETAPLPALPVPCKGAGNPRMVVLDVAIIRTEDTASTSYGVNMLSGLTYIFSRARQTVDTITRPSNGPETRTITITRTRSDSLANPNTAAGIAYSLNIANATDSRSEVLAQPSLLALDRQSSTFFSGRNITLGIAGQAGGASTFTDRPVGVSLSVTPTFVDAETMLVSARAARSFVEQVDENVIFGQTMQTSRNSVTANVVLKFGETLVLSGLAEQEVQRASDGVPVLQDIPVLQYLFRNRASQTFRRSVLVLITPRKPQVEQDELARQLSSRSPANDGERAALLRKLDDQSREGKGTTSAITRAYRHALQSKLFLQFRSGDMQADDWSTASRLDKFFDQLGGALYF